jgi:hypothetical protein
MCAGSRTHVDLADDADRLVVIAPATHPALPGGDAAVDDLAREITRWRARNPGATVDVFVPDAEALAALGTGRLCDLFRLDARLAHEAERHGRRQAAQWLHRAPLAS